MNKQQIIDQIVNDPQYLSYCKRVCGGRDIHKDLYQFVILTLLETNDKKIEDIYNGSDIRMYVARIIYINANSYTAPFLRQQLGTMQTKQLDKACDFIPEPDEATEFDLWMDKFDSEIEKECNRCYQEGVYPAAVRIYQEYEKIGDYTALSRCTQIPYKTVQRYVHGTRAKILKRINENIDSNATA